MLKSSIYVLQVFQEFMEEGVLNRNFFKSKESLQKKTFIDLFSGIGGFRLGLESSGLNCVFSSEIDEHCRANYQSNFNDIPIGDIIHFPIKDIPDHDLLAGGFPCQSFSICGKRRGFSDIRGSLFFHICKIIKIKQPKVIFLENVKYLIYHNEGKTLKIMLSLLKDIGYHVNFRVLNACSFGVPQNRERIIIIGSKKPFDFNTLALSYVSNLRLLDFLDKEGDFDYLKKEEYILIKNPVQKEKSGMIFCGYRKKNIWRKGIRPNTEHLSRVHRQPNRIYSVLGTHPTIPSQETAGRFFIYFPEDDRVRKLTIKECYRIMGFPDNFNIYDKKLEAYKQIGNSICVPMVRDIAEQIQAQGLLNEKTYQKKSCSIVEGNIQQGFNL